MAAERELLLEIIFKPTMALASGIRVFTDGLYQYRSGDKAWNEVCTFSKDEMGQLAEAIKTSGYFDLPAAIKPETRFYDGTVTTWRIHLNDQSHDVRLEPGASVPALDRLYRVFSQLRKTEPERSVWEIRQPDGQMKKFSITGSVNAVQTLRPLIAAMFQTGNPLENIGGTGSHSDLLIKTIWFTATGIQETEYYKNGKYTRLGEDGKRTDIWFGENQVRIMQEAIASINWENLSNNPITKA